MSTSMRSEDLDFLRPKFEEWKKNETVLDFLFQDGPYLRTPIAKIVNIGSSFIEIEFCGGSLHGKRQIYNIAVLHRIREHKEIAGGFLFGKKMSEQK